MQQTLGTLLHECLIPVRWGDQDALGHVNNTVFFRFMEQARVEWLDQQGFACDPANPQVPVIVHAACTFLQPINYPASVRVKLYVGEPGRSSIQTRYELTDSLDGRLYATGEAKAVWISLNTGKSAPLPQKLLELIG
ncbi:acyl-CoA thioesterase [Niveibacterium sp. 24ML]|uniref:acyl-CoA thioesterase n=1 Tax=Niveibacterium sp. 24ML TaxID=2985512 RepID=UPI002270C6A9|nr:thioesterase family protein [Niveibacterium sp. 24ML]MCX9158410.1 acyl-CoA thioesterase [Niveibacterium sp. 24ML]